MSRRYALALVLPCLGSLTSCQWVLSFDREGGALPGDAGVDVSIDAAIDAPVDAPVPVLDADSFACNVTPPLRCLITQTCCYVMTNDPNSCAAQPQDCESNTFPIVCTSAAHCATIGRVGQVCCGTPSGNYYSIVECVPEANCNAPSKRMCRTSADCPNSGPCTKVHGVLGTCD